ncbi:Methyl esterase 17 [Tripterygium wilfordii]|uniref:Methyl esterase 17 n=1 Tax=Tripterygium wilfordii TaxID=458696 RepID=A0A7J7E226_TRIWF|nr:methylesterase 17-like [Tripterygium wilfordii]KAF5752637.1 Methyl esterase 17 [Tripterygium wilfordii]
MPSMGEEEKPMKEPVRVHFVLVHGISTGSWCWYKIKCLMENSGLKVSCVDLKSAGIDPSDANSLLSFDDYNQPLLDFMSSLPDHEQVVLVGHSAGGLSVTQATHKFPKKIRLAVYVAATMIKLGFLTDEDLRDGVPDLSGFGDVYELGFGLGSNQPPTSALIKREHQKPICFQMSPHEDCALASMLMRPGPLMALTGAKFKDMEDDCNEGAESVPRVYIKTRYDHVVKPEQQEAMINRWPPSEVFVLESDHSPFFSTPFLLFGLLLKAATSI